MAFFYQNYINLHKHSDYYGLLLKHSTAKQVKITPIMKTMAVAPLASYHCHLVLKGLRVFQHKGLEKN